MRAGLTWRAWGATVAMVVVAAGCGFLQPTPARIRPPLPEPEPMPGLAVEDVVDRLTTVGFDCWFDPGGDIPPSWRCQRGDQDESDYVTVSIPTEQTGPIERLSVYRQLGTESEPLDPAALDEEGTAVFREVMALIVPEANAPTLQQLHDGVQRNFPIELGDGWYAGFDRNMISRTLHILYASE